jgi:hypothetical protein
MNESEFRVFLKQQRRKASAIEQIIGFVREFEVFYQHNYHHQAIDQTTTESLESYISWLESESGESASKPLWALRYYFDFIEDQTLSDLAGDLRSERIKRRSFKIAHFLGIDPEHVAKLGALYIENVDQMLDAGRTPKLRRELAEQTDLHPDVIIELVTLSDLARLEAVRSVRARLYFDAGLTPKIIATWEPDELHAMLVDFVARTRFDGLAPFPKEVQHLVENARKLPTIVVY